jgi:hypothetical protein
MAVRCVNCQTEYPSTKGFQKWSIVKGKKYRICPVCSSRQDEYVYLFSIIGSLLAVIICFNDAIHFRALFLFLSCAWLTFSLAILPHELGHALAAYLTGLRLFSISFGTRGRLLYSGRFFGCNIVFHRSMLCGITRFSSNKNHWFRLRLFLAVLAGPLVNVIMIFIAIHYLFMYNHEAAISFFLYGFIWGNTLLIVFNLVPRKVLVGNNRVPNDGLLLFTIPFMPRKTLDNVKRTYYFYQILNSLHNHKFEDAEQWLAKGMEAYSDNLTWSFFSASILISKFQFHDARERLISDMKQQECSHELKPFICNAIAWLDLMIADPALLEEADRFSQLAMEESPWLPQFRGTRGSVLIEIGRVEDGLRLISQAFYENDAASRALNACYLAIAENKLGNKLKANIYLTKARKLDAKCPLIERAVKSMGA